MEKRKMTFFGVISLLLVFSLGVVIVIFQFKNFGSLMEFIMGMVASSMADGTSIPEVNLISITLVVIYSGMFFYLIFAYIGTWIGVGSRKQGGYLVSMIFGFFALFGAFEVLALILLSDYIGGMVENLLSGLEYQIDFFIDLKEIKFEAMVVVPLSVAQFIFAIISYARQVSLNKKAKLQAAQ
ncbi:hypothetical protein LJC17_05210 [Acholeplasma sp. OttesenSCG-928-E16]|nr:hypothetical protein [Acholeplasma sp. OttesenSCG-928-E16]